MTDIYIPLKVKEQIKEDRSQKESLLFMHWIKNGHPSNKWRKSPMELSDDELNKYVAEIEELNEKS